MHNPPYQDWGCCLTVGNTSALDIALRMFTERGDYLLCEEYMFSSAIESAGPLGLKLVGIKMDEQGLLPEHLDALLCDWDAGAKKKPAVLYTVPSGQNPTGATQSADRRRAIYAVAQKHDLYILEDEPYYFLQMAPYTAAAGASPSPSSPPPPPSEETSSSPLTHEAFLAALVPSLLSMDVDGRVLRLDSFSKVVAPGSRTGWVTGSDQVVERFVRHNEVSVQTPSGFAQLVLFKLLDEHWGHAGYLDWLIHLRLQYTRRRDVMLRACERFLPREVVRWTPPAAGMFVSFFPFLSPSLSSSSTALLVLPPLSSPSSFSNHSKPIKTKALAPNPPAPIHIRIRIPVPVGDRRRHLQRLHPSRRARRPGKHVPSRERRRRCYGTGSRCQAKGHDEACRAWRCGRLQQGRRRRSRA